MNSFIEVIASPDFPFIRNALLAGLLSAVLFGILGSLVLVRRIASLAGAISHAVLGGIGMALYLSVTIIPGFPPLAGAFIFALLAAVLIGLVSRKAKQREDTVINAIWAIGMSIGVLFMAKTPGYVDASSYLFGNILLISDADLSAMAVLDLVLCVLVWRFYPQLEAFAFDEEFAQVRGLRVNLVFMLLLAFTAAAVVLLQTFVGIVMVIAMLTLPAGSAGCFARSLGGLMLWSSVFSALFSSAGLFVAWVYDLPTAAVSVVIAGLIFLGTVAFKKVRSSLRI
ncbi:metal ABC transporter permease [Breznakiellaceae bacterium SP9]